jgi:hypothetical protein
LASGDNKTGQRLTSSATTGDKLVEQRGARPFVSRRVWQTPGGGTRVWSSRHHRKNLALREARAGEALVTLLLRCLFMPHQLNWWIGFSFAVGASLFACGSLLSLYPELAASGSVSSATIAIIFFTGSIPFTTAAYLQLWQAANARKISGDGSAAGTRYYLFNWLPGEIGWLSCALQFVGTLLFNINTFDAMSPTLNWVEQDIEVWLPNFFGSVAFLASGYLAFIEVCHRHWAWQPDSITWWLVFTNLIGCIAFMVSALTAMSFGGSTNTAVLTVSLVGTLTGALCFLTGALLTLLETAESAVPAKTSTAEATGA